MWQVAHCAERLTLLCRLAGVQLVYPLRWQVSQLALAVAATNWYGVWVADLPSAGGKAPLWQVAHWPDTATCVWLKLVGFHAVVLWQLMQLVADTGTCVPGLPVAALPL